MFINLWRDDMTLEGMTLNEELFSILSWGAICLVGLVITETIKAKTLAKRELRIMDHENDRRPKKY
jgi:hypothetical protein